MTLSYKSYVFPCSTRPSALSGEVGVLAFYGGRKSVESCQTLAGYMNNAPSGVKSRVIWRLTVFIVLGRL